MGKRQVADVLLVHAPELEEKFMAEGYGEERPGNNVQRFHPGRAASGNPAGIKGKAFPEAFRLIASQQQPFVSQADNSGTHPMFWKEKSGEK